MHAAAINSGKRSSIFSRACSALALIYLWAVCTVSSAFAQAGTSAATQANAQNSAQNSKANAQSSGAAQQKPAPVTTTVIVHGEVEDDYLPESVTVGSLDGGALKNLPLSASVVTRDLLNDQVSRLLSDVIQNDASVGDDYVPVGYYGDFQIRGFPLDLATGLEINGMTIAGEQDVPLENKESVEILAGIAGVESGVASAGGLIDYVTKRPVNIQAVDFATDHRGSAYGAADLGHLFGARKQVGVRVNVAGERIVTYMNDTNGWRAVGAGAADWKLNSSTTLKGDFEYQHKTERDGSGYQLLGGTMLPDINRIYRSTMLGDQPWGLPDTYDTFNTDARIDRTFSPSWTGFAAASLSHSLIQDNVLYVYGCYYEAECNDGSAPPYFFAPDGTYDVYDYRDPNELRIDAEAEAMVTGHIKTGAVTNDVTAGGMLFLRSVQQPGFYAAADPYSADGVVQDGAVYTYVGSANIYQNIAPLPAPGDPSSLEYPLQSAGPRRLWEDSHQSSGAMQDRIHLPKRVQLIAAARYDSLRDHNYSAYASCSDPTDLDPATAPPPGQNPCAPELSDKPVWLPQFAVTYNPVENLTLYSNYGVTLSLGPQAPFWVDNGSQFLAPFFTRQAEVGAKYEPGQRILLTADYFHMRAPFFYPKTIAGSDDFCPAGAAGDECFEQEGRETHNGVELNAEGRAVSWLHLNGSATAMSAVSTETGTPSYDNKQVINVPRVHTYVFADVTVPHWHNLHLMPGWSYTSRKEAVRDDLVSVPSYNLFNLGARYMPGGEQGHVAIHIYADNIGNKHYWSDTGASLGDTFVWLGAPPTVRLDAHYTF
ncbi:MAG TPA: TonB-dependent siderophore receptor [Terracidiphilus sp.]|nr:TonB-dependent siderophore receptor [Terracidiphilus sp.]